MSSVSTDYDPTRVWYEEFISVLRAIIRRRELLPGGMTPEVSRELESVLRELRERYS